ncbi:MAG: heme biosynthesis HemY N-terminal domain-containing protein [Pseudomonadota bacterium]
MIRTAIFFLVVFALAVGFGLLADRPGDVEITWLGYQFKTSMMTAMVVIVALIASIMITWWLLSSIWNSPKLFANWRKGRRRDRGYAALSKGLVAAGAGDQSAARLLAKQSGKLLKDEPLVALLDAQTAILEGNHELARERFEEMLANPDTRLLGLRGLFIESEKLGDRSASQHFAKEAFELAPTTGWAAQAVLRNQSTDGDWEGALLTLESNKSAGLEDQKAANRKKAVLLTARAMAAEASEPDKARTWAFAAHKLEPSLVPAVVVGARLASRAGEMRKATKMLETSWKLSPHPDIADAYVHVRSGDSTLDRLKRAKALASKRQNHPEGQFAVAQAAIDASEWDEARKAMEPIIREVPTERACLLMADIEEGQFGATGRVRDWLSRAVRSPRDAVWTADGHISEEWAPISPVTGRLDAFEWKVPVEQIGAGDHVEDYSEFVHMKAPEPEPASSPQDSEDVKSIEATPDVEEAIVIEAKPVASEKTEVVEEPKPASEEPAKAAEPEQAKEKSDHQPVVSKPAEPDPQGEPAPPAQAVEAAEQKAKRMMKQRPDDPGVPGANGAKVEEKRGFLGLF